MVIFHRELLVYQLEYPRSPAKKLVVQVKAGNANDGMEMYGNEMIELSPGT